MADVIAFLEARVADDEAAVRAFETGMQGTDEQVPVRPVWVVVAAMVSRR